MSTSPQQRPRGDQSPRSNPFQSILNNLLRGPIDLPAIRAFLLVVGAGAFILGALIWLFIRDLSGPGLLLLGIGGVLLLADVVLSWRAVAHAVFGRRGRYGLNTMVIVLAFVTIGVVVNFVFFWLSNRPDPMGWLRVDTTATKQFSLSGQSVTILTHMDHPVRANAFFTTASAQTAAEWSATQDLLEEFKRRSNGKFTYQLIDPELQPQMAQDYRVTNTPAIAFENMDTRRIQVVTPSSSAQAPNLFNENNIDTGLLEVNQIKQKEVAFITGHGERGITDASSNNGFGLAAQALQNDNYAVSSITLQELGQLLVLDSMQNSSSSTASTTGTSTTEFGTSTLPGASTSTSSTSTATSTPQSSSLPAVVVIADPTSDLIANSSLNEAAILQEYIRRGGNVLFMLGPNTPNSWRTLLGQYGLTIGNAQLVDTSSFVAPNPNFLQIKRSNGQFPSNSPITAPLDVLYVPDSTFVASTVNSQNVPIASDSTPYIATTPLAVTTVSSWEETGSQIHFDPNKDIAGPLPIAISANVISALNGTPTKKNGSWVTAHLVVMGDSDFASNQFFSSAKNGDFFANSVDWLAKDYQLISTRPKLRVFRQLVLTTPERNFVRWTGWLLMPALIGLAGVVSWWRRR